jgi:hypothetical protein
MKYPVLMAGYFALMTEYNGIFYSDNVIFHLSGYLQ